MMQINVIDIPLREIDVPEGRARDYDAAAAEALAAVIAVQGLHHPIRVRRDGARYRLISGRHRLGAMQINGAATIAASISGAASDDEARLEEVMENLARGELIALDRCHHLYELKLIHIAAHPDAVRGGRPKSGKTFPTSDDAEVFGLASTVAEKVGLSKRAINMAVKIWTDLTPASRLRLIGTDLARKQTELKALSELSAARQNAVLDLIADPDSDVSNVAGAVQALAGGIIPSAAEKKLATLRDGLRALPDESFDRVVEENEERIIASLKRRGRV